MEAGSGNDSGLSDSRVRAAAETSSPCRLWRLGTAVLVTAALAVTACSGGADPSAQAGTMASPDRGSTSLTDDRADRDGSAPGAAETTTAPVTTTTLVPGQPPGLSEEDGDLVSGVRGTRTLLLQQRLDELGFDPGPVDGAYGPKTILSVWAWQALNGYPTDGVVTAEQELRIHADAPQGMLRPELGPTHTEVDLDRQVILVFQDGVLELASHISSASGEPYTRDNGDAAVAATPTGDYDYQRRVPGWRDAPLGRLYNPVYFTGGYAVHGSGSVPVTPASHGCVRIPMHIAEYFPSLVDQGEPISLWHGGTGPT